MVRAAAEIGTELGAAIILAAHRRLDRWRAQRPIHIHQRFEDQAPDRVFIQFKQDIEKAVDRASRSRVFVEV